MDRRHGRGRGSRFAFSSFLYALLIVIFLSVSATAQRIAFLSPDASDISRSFAESLGDHIGPPFRVVDPDLSSAAYISAAPASPFNMSTAEAKIVGSAIGCDFYVVAKAATLRRSSFQLPHYFESHASLYVVSTRTGRLVHWRLVGYDSVAKDGSQRMLMDAAGTIARELAGAIRSAAKIEIESDILSDIEEVPDEQSPSAKNFRPPVPFRRIKPVYTEQAAYYDIAATVEIEVDLDPRGIITRTAMLRWAGFGLDESVENAVRQMNWRPAERNGKSIPMRFVLRYNFKRVEKD